MIKVGQMNKKCKSAHIYRDRNFNVFPVGENKRPLESWKQHQDSMITHEQIDAYWKKYPDANIAIVTGEVSGLTVLDIDTEVGLNAYKKYGCYTPEVDTPNGGKHVYFQFDASVPTQSRGKNDWDWRGPGGYVVAPPSRIGEKIYAWNPEKRIDKISIQKIPLAILNSIHSNNTLMLREGSQKNGGNKLSQESQTVTERVLRFARGSRDNDLFHAANMLVRGGMDYDNIFKILMILAMNCEPPFSKSEAKIKIDSALKRYYNRSESLVSDIREMIETSSGLITTTSVHRESQAVTKKEKKQINNILYRFAQDGLIERTGRISGEYRIIEKDCEPEDWLNATTTTCEIDLPFGLGDMVHIMPGDIILFSGVPGVGKTAVLLNAAISNLGDYNVHYFSSELRPGTFKRRLSKLDTTVPEALKGIKFYQRYDNYHDVIKSGEGNLNVIDYIKVLDNFYIVGKIFADIAKKLRGAIAIVSLQKQYGSKTGLGGMFSQFEPVLSVNLDRGEDYSIATISKTKEYKEEYIEKFGQSDGFEYHFKIVNGIKLIKVRYWHRPFEG